MKALTNHVVPSRSAQLVHFPMVLLFSPLLPLLTHSPTLFLSRSRSFLHSIQLHTPAHIYTIAPIHTYTQARLRTYRSLLYPFIFLYGKSGQHTEAETNSCTLIQFVRIKDTINNVFSRWISRDRRSGQGPSFAVLLDGRPSSIIYYVAQSIG